MDLKLKSIKHYPSMSEETECFDADLWVGKKKVVHISNRGIGGSDDHYVYEGMHSEFNAVVNYCKNLPKVKTQWGELDNDIELVTSKLLSEWLRNKDFKKGIVFKDSKGIERILTWKGNNIAKMLSTPKGRLHLIDAINDIKRDKGKILNTNLDNLQELV